MPEFMNVVDRATRTFWRVTGQPVDLLGAQAWLSAPMHQRTLVADDWLADTASTIGGSVRRQDPGAGLLPRFEELDGPTFQAKQVHPDVRDFYEHTAQWRMEVWTQWNPWLRPAGDVVSRYFGRRVQQLAIPTRPMDVALGMDSEVASITGGDGTHHGAAWIRTLRSTGAFVYSGYYRVTTLPETSQPSVHVSFPLESGNMQVFLQPRATPEGFLELLSPRGEFGTNGAYMTVEHHGHAYAARVPLHEVFRIYVDDEGTLRTDHTIRLRSTTAVRLHYKLLRRT